MITMSEEIGKLATALVKAQAEVESALKFSTNPHYGSPYADLTSVLTAIKPALAKHGLAMVQYPGYGGDIVTMITVLIHESGEWLQSPVASIPITKKDPHGAMSGITYLRRGCASSLMALIADDDDGNEATAQAPKASAPKKKAKAAFKPAADDAGLDEALAELSTAILECEADGGVEARHIKLARTVVEKRGKPARKGQTPLDRVTGATTFLAKLLAEK